MFAAILPQVSPGSAYLPLEASPADLHKMLDALRLIPNGGFNVTIPHKVAIIDLLDEVQPDAEAVGAVNCVAVRKKRLVGFNTDVPALRDCLAGSDGHGSFSSAMVLGAGGAARCAVHVLRSLGVPDIAVAARRTDALQAPFWSGVSHVRFEEHNLARAARACDLVINSTPVGMWPDVDSAPLRSGFHEGQLVFDMVYNPCPTLLLQLAKRQGAAVADGLEMLARQAALSLEIWTGAKVSFRKFLTVAAKALTHGKG